MLLRQTRAGKYNDTQLLFLPFYVYYLSVSKWFRINSKEAFVIPQDSMDLA